MMQLAAKPAVMDSIRVRPARREDFEAIRRNHQITFEEHAARETGFHVDAPFIEDFLADVSRPFGWLRGIFGKERSFILVAEAEGRVAGHIAYTRHSNHLGPYAAVVGDVSIDPAHRRAGLGRALVDAMERREARDGTTSFAAAVWPENRVSQHLFETLGYAPFEGAVGSNEPEHLVHKSIPFSTLPLAVTMLKSAALTLLVIAAAYQLSLVLFG